MENEILQKLMAGYKQNSSNLLAGSEDFLQQKKSPPNVGITSGVYGQPFTSDYANAALNTGSSLVAGYGSSMMKGITSSATKSVAATAAKSLAGESIKGAGKEALKGMGAGALSGLKNFKPSPAALIGIAADSIGKPLDNQSAVGKGVDMTANALMMIPGPTMAIGAAMKVAGAVDRVTAKNATTLETDGMSATGWGALETNQYQGTSYGGLFGRHNAYGGRKTQDTRIKALEGRNTRRLIAGDLQEENSLASANSSQSIMNKNTQQREGRSNSRALMAKHGASIKNILKIVEDNKIPIEEFTFSAWEGDTEALDFLQAGGTIKKNEEGEKVNVIPDGALHSRKHNLDIKGITKKGIPVVTEDDKVVQHAEVEKDEIILYLELSKKLEKATKEYYELKSPKEKATLAIEIGKMLTLELLENTEDKSGYTEKFGEGGKVEVKLSDEA